MNYHAHPVWRSQLGTMLIFLILIGVAFFAGIENSNILLALWIMAGITLIFIVYRHFAHTYEINEGTIESTHGIIAKNQHSIRLKDIRNVNYHQSILGRLLNYGAVDFSSSAGGGVEVVFQDVNHPEELKAKVQEAMPTRS